ncbi:MAG: ribosomal L7Ae/L30e/S12e/Gadd45 family protein [Oscillospiraceae bacterium]|nr:ribosomal L7Ae/L30e/S12e/Gadd45 family protein [Oscillospiraceae bacterium]
MLSELSTRNKIVGIKQLRKALRDGKAAKVFVAADADPKLTQPILASCQETGVPVEEVSTMQELGKACEIEVGAAVAALLGEQTNL